MPNLKKIFLISNSNLKNVTGISNLKNLQQVAICGNDIRKIDNIFDYFVNTKNAQQNILDVNILLANYPIIKKSSEFLMSNCKNLTFGEKISFGEIFETNLLESFETYDIASNLKNQLIGNELLMYDIYNIYRYVRDNLIYDYELLSERSLYILKNGYNALDPTLNKFKFPNTSYKAFKDKTVACEGYAKMMQYLLELMGVETRTVYCHNNLIDEFSGNYDHTMMKFKYNGEWLYCDVQIADNLKNQNYICFAQPQEEIVKKYELYPTEFVDIKNKKNHKYYHNI